MTQVAPGQLVVSAEGRRWQFTPGSRAVIGRGTDCQVVLADTRVSRRHLELAWESGSWFVRDLGSANGTFQDGRRLTNEPVGAARVVRLGHATDGPLVELVVEGQPAYSPPAQPQPSPSSPPPQPSPAPSPPSPTSPPAASPPPQRATPAPPASPPPASPPPAPPASPPPASPPPGPPASPPPAPLSAPQPPAPAPPRYQVGTASPPAQPSPASPPAMFGPPAQTPGPPPGPAMGDTAIRLSGSVRIGRDVDNELVLADLLVSRHHARIDTTQYGFQIVDLGSSNKTFVNGVPVTTAPLREGDLLTIGRTRFVQDRGVLREVREQPAAELAVEHLTLTLPDGKTLTNNVSLRLTGPKLVALLGPSGAGKSTVLRLIAGETEPTGGQVRYQNVDVHTHYAEVKSRIGMVPQHTVAHSLLTARYALRYAAQLRLSGDVTEAERERRVDQVLGELGLTAHADTRVDRLSGGQQRRLAIGFELLTRTSLLLLDEPTSGLDPALAYEVMRLLRRLADEGRQVLVTTHDTAHLDMCDAVVAMANGGTLAYVGPPDGIASQFGTPKWPEIFTQLAAAPAPPPQPLPPGGKRPRRPSAPPPPPQAPGRRPGSLVGRQFGVLCRRQLRLMFSDVRYAAFLGLMPVALAILALIVTDSDGLGHGAGPVPQGFEVTPNPAAMRLVLVLIVGALFTGMASSVRELVGERPIYQYERAAGLTAEAYLLSKLLIFSAVAVMQSVLLVGVVRLFRPGPDDAILLGFGTLEIILAVTATAVVSSVLGLLVSSLMTTVEQTMPPLVVAVMAQLVLSGGLGVEVAGRPVLEQISWLAPARWGYASAAGTIDLTALAPNGPDDPLWSHHPAVLLGSMAVLFVMAIGFALLTLRFVRRR